MILNYFSFLSKKTKCQHEKITPLSTCKYCPDCGKEISINWFILRCNSCSSKRESMLYFNTLVPAHKHCSKCGCSGFYIEKKEHLDFFDLNFAVMTKEEVKSIANNRRTQIWIEQDNCWQEFILPKLIPLLLK